MPSIRRQSARCVKRTRWWTRSRCRSRIGSGAEVVLNQIPTLLEKLVLGRSIARRAALAARVPRGALERVQAAEFQSTLARVGQHSRFYQRQFAARGLDPRKIKRPQDLGGFYTTATDLREQPVEDFLCARPQAGFETTGTTARNKRVRSEERRVGK